MMSFMSEKKSRQSTVGSRQSARRVWTADCRLGDRPLATLLRLARRRRLRLLGPLWLLGLLGRRGGFRFARGLRPPPSRGRPPPGCPPPPPRGPAPPPHDPRAHHGGPHFPPGTPNVA